MQWLSITREPCALKCAYCGQSGKFLHALSYEHEGETFSLYACSNCGSLIYDLHDIDALVVTLADLSDGDISREARYGIETGFSSHHVAACALSALPEIPEQELKKHVFVDVGAGLGMASYFVRTLFDMQTVTIEPSFTGKISHDLLGLDVHRAYFEDLPREVLTELANKPCLLHLNSVVEHLVDPAAVLTEMMARARVEVIAAIVPDGAWIDPKSPFLGVLPFLAPRDHRHLPTKLGMELLFRRLGFEHVSVQTTPGLLTGIGSRFPIPPPSERSVKLAERVFLEDLKRHSNPLVAAGGASRLLPTAVLDNNSPLTAELVSHFPYEERAPEILEAVRNRSWDDLPFHLGPTCYWLAYIAVQAGRFENAIRLLEITKAFGEAMARDYPSLAMTSIDFKWSGLLLQSYARAAQGDMAGAEGALRAVLASKSDVSQGAGPMRLRQAELDLKALRKRNAAAPPRKMAGRAAG